ncbi:hypothetical protein [Nocardiopsis sp. NRRL B-16309]|uniref:hypothetical protein n=1 Tax=Nocardiopsis sp. NRRL B-16309 TaxID=1519494 RepID=UPI0006AFB65A|nr:hypothetical protein [Nocardiopsis sp. NRRL B-16309]KOX11842.1 hypothetical protein ADL05_23060 [Nocardiopsis sp. NRRL B-16309]
MIRGFFARLIPICVVLIVVLWFFRAPESVAGLIVGAVGLIGEGADAMGRFATSLTPAIDTLL